MPARFETDSRTLRLSVLDLIASGLPSGHLVLDAPQSSRARLEAGRQAHATAQGARADDPSYTSEVPVIHVFGVGAWTVEISGRVDGLVDLGGQLLIEEIKSTALDIDTLRRTRVEQWPAWTAQLETYLWMLARSRGLPTTGRLVLISLLDGGRHDLPVPCEPDRLERWVQRRVGAMIRRHQWRTHHDALRATARLRWPFRQRRPGQTGIRDAVREALSDGTPLLVQAPTGLGKTAAVAEGVLDHAARAGRQVFWATSRNTQRAQVLDTFQRFAQLGMPLTTVTLLSKEQACLNTAVTCRPDLCPFAKRYVDKVDEARLVDRALEQGGLEASTARQWGADHQVCPYQLLIDVAEHADVVVGDVNFAFRPRGGHRRLFAQEAAAQRVVVVDEAHQLADRIRGHRSPRLTRASLHAVLRETHPAFEPFLDVATRALALLDDAIQHRDRDRSRDDEALTHLDPAPWRDLAKTVDGLAFDHALLRVRHPHPGIDPYPEVARALLDIADALQDDQVPTHALVRTQPDPALRLICLDAAPLLAPQISALAGFIGLSATLSPPDRTRGLLGLSDEAAFIDVPSPFDADRRPVFLAPHVSTRYRDRQAHTPAIAHLLERALAEVPGHAAIFVSSFERVAALSELLHPSSHEVVAQQRHMDDDARQAVLDRLTQRRPAVLLGVLGGIFAEGVDPPPGALRAVFIVGPGLPPVGLEQDLLTDHHHQRFGDGWTSANLVPGMHRVIQAAGRLVRRPEDRGAIVLVGRRFRWREPRHLLPADWQPQLVHDPAEALAAFFQEG